MTRLYTTNHIQSLKARLSNRSNAEQKFDSNVSNAALVSGAESSKSDDRKDYGEHYFQLLMFDGDCHEPKLVYGTKKDLQKKYKFKKHSLTLPTKGVEIDKDFFNINDNNGIDPDEASSFAITRNLLQTRKLSQIMAYTWLNLKDKPKLPEGISEIQIKLVKKIFDAHNIIPKEIILQGSGQDKDTSKKDLHANLIETQLKLQEQRKEHLLDFLIMPESISYGSISLALLLSGQAYYKYTDEWKPIWKSIFGTLEVIREYSLEVNWDSFYGSIVELSQAGETPQYPYNRAILGYPPRPNKFNLTQEQILDWATAEDLIDDSKRTKEQKYRYPFYPDKNSQEWNHKKLKYVDPPFPYIPLSSS